MKWLISIVLILGALAAGIYLMNGGPQSQSSTVENPNVFGNEPTTTPSSPDPLATTTTTEIDVSMWNYGFTPSVITVKKGDHVKVNLTDTGGLHDFVIDEFNAKTPRLDTGATTSVEFDATLAGTFQYYSSVGNNRANGMWGNIVVAP